VGRSGLEFLKAGEMMVGERYRKVYDDKLELFMNMHETPHFLQDGGSCHWFQIVTEWFKERPHIQLIK
jgi:hypothetical protein